METSLFAKTMIILCSQLGIVFIGAYLMILKLRKATLEGKEWMGTQLIESYNEKGELDLLPTKQRDPETGEIVRTYYIKGYNILRMRSEIVFLSPEQLEEAEKDPETGEPITWIADSSVQHVTKGKPYEIIGEDNVNSPAWFMEAFILWAALLFGCSFVTGIFGAGISVGLPLMTAVSLLFAPILAWMLILSDENDGIRIMWLTIIITIFCGLIGSNPGLDFSFLQGPLFIGLLFLLGYRLYQVITGFVNPKSRGMAIFGCILFTLFILFDFNRLAQLNEVTDLNNWDTAFSLAFSLYLDIINLLLELLEAMG